MIKKTANLLSYGYFHFKDQNGQIIHFSSWTKYGITSYLLRAQDCISFLYLRKTFWASDVIKNRWWKILSPILAIFTIFRLFFITLKPLDIIQHLK